MSATEAAQAETATAAPAETGGRTSSSLGKHQSGLDGMRALGMSIMLGYHGQLPWTRGAFLALSQFFTLSGFLITGVLLRNHLVPGGNLRGFWERRIRRLMPAAFVVLIGIVIFGATVATRQQADALPAQIAAAATWTANWQFTISGASYINLFAAPSPVQHFWSLAIEEQFYLLLPIALLLVVRRTRSPRVLGGLLGAGALLSTAWMITLYDHGASLDRLYYGTDTRMAELLTGATLGVVIWHKGLDFSERTRQVLVYAGIAAFAATLWCWVNIPLADGAIWRGGFLLYSLLSCTMILAVLGGRGPLVRLLEWGPLPAMGRITYGLYLYHWPIFLWLTEDRVGLSRWPLFVVRMVVTFAAAILSYNLIERPVMRGATFGLRGRARFVIAPVTAVAIIAAAFIFVNHSANDPLATLHAGAASLTMPRESSDGVLDLLVIPGRADDPVIARIQAEAEKNSKVNVTVADPFRCTGGLVAVTGGKTCANLADSWPELIKQHNPDVTLFAVDNWAGDGVGQLTGAAPAEQSDATVKILSPAFDLLTARGAPVVWAQSGTNFGDALRRSLRPFNQAVGRLRAERSDIFEVIGGRLPDPGKVSHEEYVSRSATVLLDDASLYQRTSGHSLPRVMIVGDSQALSIGYGIDRWAAQHKRALVWNHGVEGCGVATEGETRSFGSTNSGIAQCRATVRAWPSQLKSFDPDVVVVFSSLTDIQDRKLPGATKFSSIGDPDFDAFLAKQYEQIIDTLSSTGARVVWMTAPCTSIKTAPGQTVPYSTAHLDHLNSAILAKVFRERKGRVVPFDLASVICPGGKPLKSVAGVGILRSDGVHFSVNGALWFADKYGEKLLKAGGI